MSAMASMSPKIHCQTGFRTMGHALRSMNPIPDPTSSPSTACERLKGLFPERLPMI